MPVYEFEVEIVQGEGGRLKKENGQIVYPENISEEGICAWMYRGDGKESYQKGRVFKYPEEAGKLCPWMLGSIQEVVLVLRNNGYLGWTYEGTPFEKELNRDGITTEFIRCIDPTRSGIVVKITRKTVG